MPTTTQFAFANNVSTTIASAITSTATTITLASSANFPTIPTGFVWPVTLNDRATQNIFEIVYVTATSGANLTVLRGQEGTAARAWSVGDYAFAANTAGALNSLVDQTYLNGFLGIFNPRAYGALGNGTTNDAAAFAAANTASAGSEIYVPPGNYLISSSISITSPIVFAAGAILTLSGTGSITATFSYAPQAGRYQIFGGAALNYAVILFASSPKSLDPIFPEWWGALPNGGSSDCGPGFQRAISSLANTFGSEISMGAGNYSFATTVSFTGVSNFVLAGLGIGATTITFTGTFTAAQIMSFGGVSSGALQTNVTLRDMAIVWSATSSVSANVLQLQYGSNAIVRNVEMTSPTLNTNPIVALAGNAWSGAEADTFFTRGAWSGGILPNSSPYWTINDSDFRLDTAVTGAVAIFGNASNHLVGTGNRIHATGSATWTLGIVPGTGSDYYHFSNNDISGCLAPYVVDSLQLNGYIDYQSEPWIPTDGSGAGLTFTSVVASYIKIGHEVLVVATLTYPTTSSGATALLNPLFAAPGVNQILPLAVTGSSIIYTMVVSSGTFFPCLATTFGNVTNATLSGKTLTFSGTYQTSY